MNDKGVEQPLAQLVYLPGQRVQPGPSRVSDSPVSAEIVVYEAFVVMGDLLFNDCMEKTKSGYKSILHPFNLLYAFPFLQERN